MNDFWKNKLQSYLHDPIDKCFDIPGHIERAKNYASKIGVSNIEDIEGPDHIASCMERSLLPKDINLEFKEIKHPLCESAINIENIQKENVFKQIEAVFDEVNSNTRNLNEKKKFFYLWRNLEYLIISKSKDENWAKYLPLLPADTRIPDHSIWEHLKISSALNAYLDEENNTLFQNNSIFLLSIGPVQGFIAQARKTQDFYYGSYILSYLTFKAIEVLIDNYGPTSVIYPDLYKQPLTDFFIKRKLDLNILNSFENLIHLPTIPNRFVAFLPTTEKSEIENLVKEIKDKFVEIIKDAYTKIYRDLEIQKSVNFREVDAKIQSQLDNFPEVYWVAIPWRIGDKDVEIDDLKIYFPEKYLKQYENLLKTDEIRREHKPNIGLLYELLYSALEKSMGARKNIRIFEQPEIEEKGRKCSVCGERDVIFFREDENKKKFTRFNNITCDLTDNKKVSLKILAKGEGLCALCFFKRTFDIYLRSEFKELFDKFSFPSTSELASSSFKLRALKDAKQQFDEYQNKLINGFLSNKQELPFSVPILLVRNLFNGSANLEGELFYEENLRDKYLKENYGLDLTEKEIKELKDALKKLYDKVGKPNPYYAIIHMDGDNMGKWLSGQLLPEIEHSYASDVWNDKLPKEFKNKLKELRERKLLTPAIHASISTALRNFSLEFVRKIVEEEHLGKLIYAGGDDVLAFVNLKDLLDVMYKLRWAFSGNVRFDINGNIQVELCNNTGFVEKDGVYLLTMGSNASASMGVVIAHYKTPLQIVIKKVFDTEKEAKKIEGKNAFAISLMRRSGEERLFKTKWLVNDIDTIELLKDVAKAFDKENENGFIAKSFIQKVASEFVNLHENGKLKVNSEIFLIEIERLLNRSFNSPLGRKIEKEKKKEIIQNVYKSMRKVFTCLSDNVESFVNLCTILTFLNKEED